MKFSLFTVNMKENTDDKDPDKDGFVVNWLIIDGKVFPNDAEAYVRNQIFSRHTSTV